MFKEAARQLASEVGKWDERWRLVLRSATKEQKSHSTAEGRKHHEIAERTEKYTFVNVGNKRGCGLWSRREQWRRVEGGEEREGGVSIQPRRRFRYVGTLGLLGTRQTLPSYYCELSQRKKEI